MTVELRRGGAADLDALEPLWLELHHRHAELMPHLGPYLDDARSWEARRALYDELLAKDGTILLLARDGGTLVGYGLAHVVPAAGSWADDTWVTGERLGEIETLVVLPSHRGAGVGTRLLDALESELEAAGVDDLFIGVVAGNTAAQRLYERRGYAPTWGYMTRLRR
jgi:ribosomal protein S18 acetylase RimI-like enzyme